MLGKIFPALVLAALAIPGLAAGDTLLVDGVKQARSSADQRPSRGMTMAQVESNWGQPAARKPAVGDPPITRWDYAGFSVFFEYSHVVHAVLRN